MYPQRNRCLLLRVLVLLLLCRESYAWPIWLLKNSTASKVTPRALQTEEWTIHCFEQDLLRIQRQPDRIESQASPVALEGPSYRVVDDVCDRKQDNAGCQCVDGRVQCSGSLHSAASIKGVRVLRRSYSRACENLCTCVPKEAYAPKVSSIEAQITRQRQQQYIRPSTSPGSLVARDTDSESQGSTRDGQAGIEDNSEDRWDDTLDYDDQGRNEDVHNWLHGLPSQDVGQEEKELEQHVWAVDQEGTENEQLFLHSMHSYILARTRLQLMVSAFQKGLFELRRGSMLEELQRILNFHENDRFPQNWAKPLEPPGASSTGDMTPGAKRPRPEDVASRAQR